VEELHAAGVMHHDIKPDNIIFNKERAMLVDFGFACKFDPAKDPLNMSLMRGTPAYMSPEILSGRRYNSKSDIWSLGVVLF
jgi:serine/threonine protein kinase